jgi:hypothetical protein
MKSRRGAKIELVEHAIEATVGEFGITDLTRRPGVSRDTIRPGCADLKSAGRIECLAADRERNGERGQYPARGVRKRVSRLSDETPG